MSERPGDEVELSADVHDRLLSYQREGEELAETLHRVFLAFVPVAGFQLDPSHIDPEEVSHEMEFVVERGRTIDGYRVRTFDDPYSYIRHNRTSTLAMLGVDVDAE